MHYLIYFIFSSFLSFALTFFAIKIAPRFGLIDNPGDERKIHSIAMPLFGGIAVFSAFFLTILLSSRYLFIGNLKAHHWLGVFGGALLLMIGGYFDDKYKLGPKIQIIFPFLAILAVIAGGVEMAKITNPFGGFFSLDSWRIPVFRFGGSIWYFSVISDIFIFLWLLGMMYTTKLLDGLDGLVSGVTFIGSLIIFLFTVTTRYYQPDIALAALILAGSALGFLFWNWHPAKIFLGEGGSLLLGFLLGVLAVISGGKIAIALLVMGLPILDVLWTIIRRVIKGNNPFKAADKKHLHFRLLDVGLSQRQAVLVFYAFSGFFGLSALFLQGLGKLYALMLLLALMIGIIAGLRYFDNLKLRKNSK
jgi:UDP-GlcNAc:undecaprenyl-phosphate GlcNAc-1-phosphate transferase